jgi:hypothetical protein
MFGALVPTSYVNAPVETQSSINATTISSNTTSINNLETELKAYTDSKVAGLKVEHGLKIIALENLTDEQATTITNLENIINQQQVQIDELIAFAVGLQGNT